MSKIAAILARIEEQAVALHEAQQQIEDAVRAQEYANKRVQALTRERDDLQRRINALVEESREVRARLSSMENARKNTPRLSQTITDAASLIDRNDLTDAEKVRSISGLLDQVLPNRKHKIPSFVKDADEAAAAPRAKRAPRTAKKSATATDAATPEPDDEHLRKEIEAEPDTDEDAREFARDY